MKKTYKTTLTILCMFFLLTFVGILSFSEQQKEKAIEKGKGMMMHKQEMKEYMGDMDDTMMRCKRMKKKMDMMMYPQMSPTYTGMESMKNMSMTMQHMSWNMKMMMENVEQIKMNRELMKDKIIKKRIEELHESINATSSYMKKTVDNMQKVSDRLTEMHKK